MDHMQLRSQSSDNEVTLAMNVLPDLSGPFPEMETGLVIILEEHSQVLDGPSLTLRGSLRSGIGPVSP